MHGPFWNKAITDASKKAKGVVTDNKKKYSKYANCVKILLRLKSQGSCNGH
jgi:hypothetical protein